MTKTSHTLLLALALGLLCLSAVPLSPVDAQQGTALAVITSAATPLDSMSSSELRRVFLGRTVEKSGVKLIPLNHAIKSSARTLFDRIVLKMSADEVGRHWVAERIRGTRSAPKSVSSVSLLLKVVSKVKGVISYVPSDKVPAGLKVLKIDGALPQSPDYPIKG